METIIQPLFKSIDDMIEILQSCRDGKAIESARYLHSPMVWFDEKSHPAFWNWNQFDYRVVTHLPPPPPPEDGNPA